MTRKENAPMKIRAFFAFESRKHEVLFILSLLHVLQHKYV